jgi:hypothetical protein
MKFLHLIYNSLKSLKRLILTFPIPYMLFHSKEKKCFPDQVYQIKQQENNGKRAKTWFVKQPINHNDSKRDQHFYPTHLHIHICCLRWCSDRNFPKSQKECDTHKVKEERNSKVSFHLYFRENKFQNYPSAHSQNEEYKRMNNPKFIYRSLHKCVVCS